ncbi:HAD family hydrolase [Allorhizocola rhizosphaerae]|uniref:HAD family hydrolase n=1 Tax=Allorhizocola rhizosphaerae TaxID=1872709 RepID=UPI000E3CDF4B|nr:HAD family hydrolase [Allorhizocola rhizosphaerae]
MLPAPRALLLDFGGVIVDSPRTPDDELLPRVVNRVKELIGGLLSAEEIAAELRRADALRDQLRDSSHDHVEVSAQKLWGELVADLWPEDAREKLLAHADELTYLWAYRPSWRVVDGMYELFDYTLGEGLPVVVVSNTRSGQAHRDKLERLGLTPAFAAQIYSDELGVCKPHPEMIWTAARFLDEPVTRCWMVGDQGKDIECARKAGTGAAILLGPGGAEEADATVANGHELLRLLR